MVRCETTEKMYEFRDRMEKDYGFEWIDAASGGIPYGASMFINLTTGFMFYCNLGVNNLSGPWIGDKAISMYEFIQIAEIYRKHTKYGYFVFHNRKYDDSKLPESSYPDVESMSFREYKDAIKECLHKALEGFDEEYIRARFDLYEEDFPEFYKRKLSPEAAAAAVVFGY